MLSSSGHKILKASLSYGFIEICKKALVISLTKTTLCILNRNKISYNSVKRLGPECKQSLRLKHPGPDRADASNTTLNLLVPFLITP